MKRLQKTITASAAVLTVLATAACGSGNGDDGAASLTVWVMGEAAPAFQEITADFTAETGIAVQVEAIPWEGVNTRLTTAVASGEGPDVTQIGLSQLPAFVDANALADLTDLATDHPSLDPSNFPAAVAPENLDPEGRWLSVPWISDTRVLFYRTDILSEVGFDKAPATWDEMNEVAAKLAERGDNEFGYYLPLWDNTMAMQYTWQAGGDVVTADGQLNLDSPEFNQAVDHWLSFFAAGAAPTAGDWDQTQGFVSGATPMVVSGPWAEAAIRSAAPDLTDWAVAPLPQGPAAGTSLYAGSNLGIWRTSEHQDEAAQLLAYMAEPETQLKWFEQMNELPTANGALEQLASQDDPFVSTYVAQLNDARTVPMLPFWDQVATELLTALTEIANGADRDSTLDAFRSTAADIASRS